MDFVTANCPECWNHVLVESDASPGEEYECESCGALSYVNWESPIGLERVPVPDPTTENEPIQDLSEDPPPGQFPMYEGMEIFLNDHVRIAGVLDKAKMWDYKQIGLYITLPSQEWDGVKVVIKKLSYVDETIPLRSRNAFDHYLEGREKCEAGLYDEAINDFDEVIRLNPAFSRAYSSRGMAKAELGRYEEAIIDYNEAICLYAHDPVAVYKRGILKAKLGRYEEAIADYDEAICLNSHDPRAYLSRGIVRSKLGVKDKARQDCQTALKLAQKTSNENLAGKAQQAIDYLNGGMPLTQLL